MENITLLLNICKYIVCVFASVKGLIYKGGEMRITKDIFIGMSPPLTQSIIKTWGFVVSNFQ